jgi:hypothetical protein
VHDDGYRALTTRVGCLRGFRAADLACRLAQRTRRAIGQDLDEL